MTSPAQMYGSGCKKSDPQNIAAPRKDCGSLVDEKLQVLIVGTLTN